MARSCERDDEQMHKKIIDAAEKQFFSGGYDSVSMDEIAEAAGLDKLTLSLYYRDIESLSYAVAVRGARILYGLHSTYAQPDSDGLEKVRAWVRVSHEFSRKYPHYFRLLGHAEVKRCDLSGDENAVEIVNLTNRMLIRLTDAIKEGMADGSIRKDLNPQETAVHIALALASILRPDHGLKSLLEGMKINSDMFAYDFRYFIARAIASPTGGASKPGTTS